MLLKEDFILCLAKLIWIVHIISFLHFLILFVKRKWTLLGLLMTLPDALSKILIIWIIFVLWNLTFFCHEIPNRSRWIIYNLGEFYYQWSVGFYPKQKIWTRVWMSVFVHIIAGHLVQEEGFLTDSKGCLICVGHFVPASCPNVSLWSALRHLTCRLDSWHLPWLG